jgi:catechol 2,3-dioxygenase-like lactoylglutathione lyase family enzyme
MEAIGQKQATIRFDHVGIDVPDLDHYTRWYSEAFDLTTEFEFAIAEAGLRGIILLSRDDWRLELFERVGAKPSGRAADPIDQHLTLGITHFCVQVSDIHQLFDKLISMGAKSLIPPQLASSQVEAESGMSIDPKLVMAYLSDPEGNLIELFQR